MKRRMFFALMASNVALASGVDQLRSRLAPAGTTHAFQGALTITTARKFKDRLTSFEGNGQVRANIVEQGDVLRVEWDNALLRRVEEGTQDPSDKIDDLTEEATRLLTALTVRRLLHPDVFLGKCINDGRLKSEREEMLNGEPVRRLVVELTPFFKDGGDQDCGSEHYLDVLIGSDGAPLASSETNCYWIKRKQVDMLKEARATMHYENMQGRLVATKLVESELRRDNYGRSSEQTEFTLTAR